MLDGFIPVIGELLLHAARCGVPAGFIPVIGELLEQCGEEVILPGFIPVTGELLQLGENVAAILGFIPVIGELLKRHRVQSFAHGFIPVGFIPVMGKVPGMKFAKSALGATANFTITQRGHLPKPIGPGNLLDKNSVQVRILRIFAGWITGQGRGEVASAVAGCSAWQRKLPSHYHRR